MSKSAEPRGRILISEDLRASAGEIAQALEDAGYEIERAHDGEECLRKARALRPEVLLLDSVLPKLRGLEVLRALREAPETAGITVIVCVPEEDGGEHAAFEPLGVAGFLTKPLDTAKVLAMVARSFQRNAAPDATAGDAENRPFRPQLDTTRGMVTLWGTRGSTPTPGARFLRHGGHTSCMSVVYEGEHYVFDAGSGIRDLGSELLAGDGRKVNLFITHTHWDHIQGFPFFQPAYMPGFEISIWGAEGFGKDLESVFRGQLDRDYFPVQMEDMSSELRFHHLEANPVVVNGVEVSWEYAQHPGATVGYKISFGGRKVAWVPDNEFLQGYTGPPDVLTRDHPLVVPYRRMIDFLADADVVIHEAQYTNDEYPTKIGWGHCCLSNACALMKLAGVKRWIVTHHDPVHDDQFLERKLAITRQILARLGHEMDVQHGHDGLKQILF